MMASNIDNNGYIDFDDDIQKPPISCSSNGYEIPSVVSPPDPLYQDIITTQEDKLKVNKATFVVIVLVFIIAIIFGVIFAALYFSGRSLNKQPDDIPPQISGCLSAIKRQVPIPIGEIIVEWAPPTATDNTTPKDQIQRFQSHHSGEPFSIGTTTIHYVFVDSSGNIANCSFDIIVSGVPNEVSSDCSEILADGFKKSGEYVIAPPDGSPALSVYCDMETDGGGWTVFQRRQDGSVDFYLFWSDYRDGFGNISAEHWLGNENIHRITQQREYELRIDMMDFEGEWRYAVYDNFKVGNASSNYTLTLDGYVGGDAGDSFYERHVNQPFTTRDSDNDLISDSNCAENHQGAWWYHGCHDSNLNALYLTGTHDEASYADGINWVSWKGYNYSLKYVDMKLRAKLQEGI